MGKTQTHSHAGCLRPPFVTTQLDISDGHLQTLLSWPCNHPDMSKLLFIIESNPSVQCHSMFLEKGRKKYTTLHKENGGGLDNSWIFSLHSILCFFVAVCEYNIVFIKILIKRSLASYS